VPGGAVSAATGLPGLLGAGSAGPEVAGVDLYSVKEFLGHADYDTTRRYAHLAPDYLKTVIRKGSLGIEMLMLNQSANWDLNRDQKISSEGGECATY
jgi:hypothetical protein